MDSLSTVFISSKHLLMVSKIRSIKKIRLAEKSNERTVKQRQFKSKYFISQHLSSRHTALHILDQWTHTTFFEGQDPSNF